MEKRRIVVVDDHEELLSLVVEFLIASGFEVFGFNTVSSVRQIAERQPNLVILDLEMPGLNGFEILKKMRETYDLTNVPVVIVTGLELRAHKDTLYLAQDILEKPFSLHNLLKQIQRLLNY